MLIWESAVHMPECDVSLAFQTLILSLLFSQRLLPIDGANDLFFQPPPLTPTSKVYTIRPYFPKDEVTSDVNEHYYSALVPLAVMLPQLALFPWLIICCCYVSISKSSSCTSKPPNPPVRCKCPCFVDWGELR